ncbi:MAG: hypothetical protein JXR31_02440 [Prolixibacteraceae bacterium]|nr:hypothetical protein [Prolixibacteraceae bacterium]MBN2773081.1 hypothetical protein [Prolixibacteraceae bacterium]
MKALIISLILVFLSFILFSQEANYDESEVPDYKLPQLLVSKSGKEIKTKNQWLKDRRAEILIDFQEEMFGRVPGELKFSGIGLMEENNSAVNGKAVRRQIRLFFNRNEKEIYIDVLMYLPKTPKPVPVFLGLNFLGNQTVYNDPEIYITNSYIINNSELGITEHKATGQSRGGKAYRWGVEKLINSGIGLVTACCGDIDPDRDDFIDGVHPMFYKEGQTEPLPDEWGTIAAWAWGLSRIMDYLETVKEVDSEKIVVLGHSRLGKTALWAGAADQRFAAVISNDSGCGGAALSKRAFGETIGSINQAFPHWFCGNFKKYGNNEAELPFDQHMLIALIAPRPVYIASAFDDQWADPKGEYLSGYYATEVYRLFGLKGLESPDPPQINSPIMGSVSYHIREGEHDLKEFDLDQYIKFVELFVIK